MTLISEKPKHGGLRRHVINELGHRIVSGELLPGRLLPSEGNLCKSLGVSRTALREALRELAAKGLLDARPKVGTAVRAEENWNFLDADILSWRIRSPDADRVISELYELRHLIEPLAASLAAKNATDKDIAMLRKAYAAMEAAGENGSKFTQPDFDFHSKIIEASGNRLFSSLAHAISAALLINFNFLRDPPRGHAHFMKGHKNVLDAVANRNAVAARLAMQNLIEDSHVDARSVGKQRTKRSRSG